MHVLKALDQFLVQLDADGRSPHTKRQYTRHVTAFARWLPTDGHSAAVAELDHWCVARFLASDTARLRPDGREKKPTTANAMRTSLRMFLKYCHDAGLVTQNPGRLVRRALCSPPPPRALTEDEERRLLEAFEDALSPDERRDAVLFTLMLKTGLRLGSAVALDVEDLDLPRGEARIRAAKGGREIVVYLNAAVRTLLSAYLADRAHGPVFTGRGSSRVSTRHCQRRFADWLRRAGVTRQLSPHALRHRFATRIYGETKDIFLTQAAMHHKSVTSTTIYARLDDRRLRAALEG